MSAGSGYEDAQSLFLSPNESPLRWFGQVARSETPHAHKIDFTGPNVMRTVPRNWRIGSSARCGFRFILGIMKKVTVLFLCALPLAASGFTVVDLQPQTVAAFDHYLQTAEERLESQGRARRLWLDAFPDRRQLVDEGKVLAEPASGSGTVQVPGGLIQDWVGAMFVPGATLDQVLV